MPDYPNSIILTGGMGAGLADQARQFLKAAHCASGTACGTCVDCQRDYTAPQVDIIIVETATKSITVDAIRDLSPQVQYGPSHYPTLWVLIPQADRMTPQAGNALLKLIEEPPAGVHFLLTAYRPWMLLPTIRSRSILRYLPNQDGHSTSWADTMKRELSHTPEVEWIRYTDFMTLNLVQALAFSEKLATAKTDAKLMFCSWIDEILTEGALGQTTQSHLQSLLNCVVQLDYNVNLRLQLDALFITLKSSRVA